MKKTKIIQVTHLLFIVFFIQHLYSQVLTWEPLFPTIDDTIYIVYHTDLGNGALRGANEIYAHTGVLEKDSQSTSDWTYVKTNWLENTEETRLTKLGPDKWGIQFHIRSYYQFPANLAITDLAFVFRTATGDRVGRDAGDNDLFIPIFSKGIQLSLENPVSNPAFFEIGEMLTIQAIGQDTDTLQLWKDDVLLQTTVQESLFYEIQTESVDCIDYLIVGKNNEGVEKTISLCCIVNDAQSAQPLPGNVQDGINIEAPSTVTLVLYAPDKEFVYLIGDFNDWQILPEYRLHQTPDGNRFWMTLSNLDIQSQYGFQYLVDGVLRIADPYTPLVLDPQNDQFIKPETYPNLKPYPAGKTQGLVSVFEIQEEPFFWDDDTYQKPDKTELVIYELLIRDFIEDHAFQTLMDTLDYLDRLGVNAIELMPVNEFEGNESWGYNPSFYFAVDKYYGSAEDLKKLINACHNRNIAVILDMVLNHAYGQCPLVNLYSDMNENPYFNAVAPHTDFSWGYDFNHESIITQSFMDRVNAYWVDEFHVDGYRFDFTRGFTNRQGNSGSYDASRIAILKRMYDAMMAVDSTTYVILEHLVDTDSEKKELADYGMLLWENKNTAYSQSVMGWLSDPQRSSDLSQGFYQKRGFSKPHLVTYMESHDEPRLIYNALQYGKDFNNYDIKELPVALDRAELAASFFFTLPGPKMMWQFGELGYDQFLPSDGPGRTAPMPILWDYYTDPDRLALHHVYADLIQLRKSHSIFTSAETEVAIRAGQGHFDRYIRLSLDSLHVVVLGNFDIGELDIAPDFQEAGWWFEYFSGDSVLIDDLAMSFELEAGEYQIYSNYKLVRPQYTSINEPPFMVPDKLTLGVNYPNPFNNRTVIPYSVHQSGKVTLSIYNLMGQKIVQLIERPHQPGYYQIVWDGTNQQGIPVASGVYIYKLKSSQTVLDQKLLLLK